MRNCQRLLVPILFIIAVVLQCSELRAQWSQMNVPLDNRSGASIGGLGVHAGRLYAGTSHGNFRTTDDRSRWIPICGGFSQSITSFAFNGDAIFASIFRVGMGVYRSTNDGETWDSVLAIPTIERISCLASYGKFILATTNSWVADTPGVGIFRSGDNGNSWEHVGLGLTDSSVYSMVTTDNGIFVGTEKGGVFKSTDSGMSWQSANNGLPNRIFVYALATGGGLLNVTTDSGLYRSSNFGSTWSSVRLDPRSQYYPMNGITSICAFKNDLFGAPGGYRSTDGGQNWKAPKKFSSDIRVFAIWGDSVVAGTDAGTFYYSYDSSNWLPINKGVGAPSASSFLMIGDQLLAGLDPGTAACNDLRSTDGGASWTYFGQLTQSTLCLIADSNDLIAGSVQYMARSTDSGLTWNSIPSSPASSSSIIQSGSSLFAASYLGIWRSDDHGNTWAQSSNGVGQNVISYSLAGFDSILVAGTSRGIFRSINYGQSWSAITNGLSDTIAVINIFKTGNYIFAGTMGLGAFRSSDSGQTWTQINSGLPGPFGWYGDYVGPFAIDGKNLFVTTYYGGVLLSTNTGSDWHSINEGLKIDPYFGGLAVMGQYLYGGGIFGIWRRPLSDFPQSGNNVAQLDLNPSLDRIYPNPVDSRAKVEIQLDAPSSISIILIDEAGRTNQVFEQSEMEIGNHTVEWDASMYPSGLYVSEIRAGNRLEYIKTCILH